MMNILYRCCNDISRRSGCAAHLISIVTLVGGMELLTQFFI